jgi:hypothetical protein
MGSVFVAGLLLALVGVTFAHQRRERVEWGRLAEMQRVALGQVLEELASLRAALVASGAVERPPRLPPPPSLLPAPPPLSPPPQTPPPGPKDDPPSTKPSRSAPRPVPAEDQIQRAMRRIERQARVPPEIQARWEQRLRALGAELGLPPEGEPSDAQLATLIRELYEAEADLKDAQSSAGSPPLEATLASAVAPVAVRIAQAAVKTDDAEGDATLRREGDRPASLPPSEDDSEDGRETGEDMTKVWSHRSFDVRSRPATVRPVTMGGTPKPPPHRPPRPIVDPLAGVTPERPKPSAARTVAWFRKRSVTMEETPKPPAQPEDGEER